VGDGCGATRMRRPSTAERPVAPPPRRPARGARE
jgi:hypothetical protein